MHKTALAALGAIVVGIFSLLAFVALFSYSISAFKASVELPLLVVGGVIALLATVGFLVVAYSYFSLHDKTQALGLPEGSIRALIALMLIIIFAIFAVYFFDRIENKTDALAADFAKQIITLVGTLLTAICSFYFGSKAGIPPGAASAGPTVTSVSPASLPAGSAGRLTLAGASLLSVTAVKLVSQANEISASNVLSSAEQVVCDVNIDATAPKRAWDVVVETADGRKATLPGKFNVT